VTKHDKIDLACKAIIIILGLVALYLTVTL